MSDFPALAPGLTGQASITVTPENTANAFASGTVDVYATPAMIALMEAAAVKALAAHLPAGITSVGTRLDVRHLAATPLGLVVTARATLIESDGRRLVFTVEAWDAVEKIGEGTHERFLIDIARFNHRLRDKQP